MSKPAKGPALGGKPPSTSPQAEIMWGCERGGSQHFPSDLSEIYARKRATDPMPLTAFGNAVRGAQKRVWVVDEYFLLSDKSAKAGARIQKILEWLPVWLVANDIKILTKQDDAFTPSLLGLFDDQERQINAKRIRGQTLCSIEVCTKLKVGFNLMHDRFAIIDDELWHFGATVGGFHTSVNAASRGWDAVDTKAIEFFELAWNQCKE